MVVLPDPAGPEIIRGLYGSDCIILNCSFSILEIISNSKLLSKAFYYSKLDLINAVKMNKVDIEEIKQRIQLSQKNGEIQ